MRFNKVIKIGGRWVSESKPVFFIAEAGVNHGGDMRAAFKMIDCAVQAGADAVKFQSFHAESLILKNVAKAVYQRRTVKNVSSQYEMLKQLELSTENARKLKGYCDKKKILFLTTFFDEYSLDACRDIDVPAFKVASTDTTNLPFLRKIAKKGKPIILSTGMCSLRDVERALQEIHPLNKNVVLLQCSANYPIRDEDSHLRVIETFRRKFNILTGYSDHSVGVGAAPYAVVLGACMIEKHFTLDKSQKGPDHKASLDPRELALCIAEIRRVEKFLGSPQKELTQDEKVNRQYLQKCLVAARDIAKGERFGENNVVAKRTGGKGISPIDYRKVFLRKARRCFRANEIIAF